MDEEFDKQIEWVRDVISRTRSAFLFANIASLIVLVALYNTYGTWMRHVAVRDGLTRHVHEAVARAQVSDLMTSSVPLLGIKVFGGDLGLISAIAMLILSSWLYYAYRREQHGVGRLIMRVADLLEEERTGYKFMRGNAPAKIKVKLLAEDPKAAEHLLWALSTSFMFTSSKIDRAVGSRREEDRYPEEGPGLAVLVKSLLLLAPLLVVWLTLLADAASLLLPSAIPGSTGTALWVGLSGAQLTEALAKLLVSGVLAYLIRPVLYRAAYFAGWTEAIYRGLAEAVVEARQRRNERPTPWADVDEHP